MSNPTIAPERVDVPDSDEQEQRELPWLVIVHNDPVNR